MTGEKKKAQRLIGLLKDGELTEKERSFAGEQIELYPDLKDESRKYELLGDMLDKARKVEIPASPHLEDAVFKRIRSGEGKGGWRRFFEGILSAPRKYSFEIVGATAVAVLVIFAVFRFLPGSTATKNIAVRETLEVGKAAPFVSEKPAESGIEGLASSPEPAKTEEAADEASEKAFEEDMAVEPLPVHEEPEDVTITIAKEKHTDKATGTAATPDLEKAPTYSDKVAVKSHEAGSKPKGLAGGFKKSDYLSDEEKGMKTLIFRATDEGGHPINLIIYTDNPDKVRYDIENKAMELGMEDKDESRFGESYLPRERTEKDTKVYVLRRGRNNIYIPQERVREFLTYIELNYPPTKSQIKELDIDERKSLLNIEFSIPEDKE
ncbi:MAG: hypothetical protein JW984_02945 [Deltaproteobacteria bacterium]|uniref:Uncharacterized protein n=1 Tax=Candidatus Zymogenus saltonus TaxID=2844893 RepID=A0A9D8PNP0_9DELT|nr:hypothetical protein [Candidatus Zymogenus saltonus]